MNAPFKFNQGLSGTSWRMLWKATTNIRHETVTWGGISCWHPVLLFSRSRYFCLRFHGNVTVFGRGIVMEIRNDKWPHARNKSGMSHGKRSVVVIVTIICASHKKNIKLGIRVGGDHFVYPNKIYKWVLAILTILTSVDKTCSSSSFVDTTRHNNAL